MEPYISLLGVILAGIFSATAAIIVAVIQSKSQHKAASTQAKAQHDAVLAEMDKRDALQAQRLDQLEKKMDKHNQLMERTFALERRADLQEEKIKVANHRLDDLENNMKG